ncbi:MAG: lipid asymmetry maintenance protein MlaB [Bacillota bacterium]
MTFRPASTLTFHNAQTVLDDGLRAIADGQSQIDLSGLTAVDSAAVATLLAWQRAAHQAGKPLSFKNLSPNLESIVALYGVGDLLHVHADASHH